jgi:SAM-dependent methyltransferase
VGESHAGAGLMTHAATRYLEAKRSVDDRAHSRRVRDRLLDALAPSPTVVDIGCGTGTMLPRLLGWGVDAGTYRGVDADETVVAFARAVRPAECRYRGWDVTDTDGGTRVADLATTFEAGEALRTLADVDGCDCVIAHAFADLVPVTDLLATIEAALAPGGLAYLPITFDGATIFHPEHPADDAVERAYHAAIDAEPGRDVTAGRRLLEAARDRDGELLAADSSDWIVRPRDGRYVADEAQFLEYILEFVADALAGSDGDEADDWLRTRRAQLRAGRLTYVAHQFDVLYRAPG